MQVTRVANEEVVLSGGADGVSGAELCGAASEVFTLTVFDAFGNGELRCL